MNRAFFVIVMMVLLAVTAVVAEAAPSARLVLDGENSYKVMLKDLQSVFHIAIDLTYDKTKLSSPVMKAESVSPSLGKLGTVEEPGKFNEHYWFGTSTTGFTAAGEIHFATINFKQVGTSPADPLTFAVSITYMIGGPVSINAKIEGGKTAPINGVCGTSHNHSFAAAPTTDLCGSGTASTVTGGNGPWNWSCVGSDGGTSADCSASVSATPDTATPVNGTCGVSNGQPSTSAPTTGLCSAGTAGAVTGTGPWNWSCAGASGGSTVNCSASLAAPPAVNGTCGSSNGQTFTSVPTSGLCGVGTASSVTGNGPWIWRCAGTNGGVSADCIASVPPASGYGTSSPPTPPTPVNGTCGTATNQTFTAAPTIELCSVGTASSVTGNGPWSWSCEGTMGGSRTRCVAFPEQSVPPDTSVGGAVSVGGTVPVTGNNEAVSVSARPINGTCGVSSGQSFATAPTTGLCNTGTSSTVTGSGPWSWSCAGTRRGSTANCSASLSTTTATSAPVNGACGASHAQSLVSAPAGLCNAGTASAVTGTGPWYWNCVGSNSGTNASCSAEKASQTGGSGSTYNVTGGVSVQGAAVPETANKPNETRDALIEPKESHLEPLREQTQPNAIQPPEDSHRQSHHGAVEEKPAESNKEVAAFFARLAGIKGVVARFSEYSGPPTVKSMEELFSDPFGKESIIVQTPAIAVSDGKSLLTVKIMLDTRGENPNFALKGANQKGVRKSGEQVWELDLLPQKGKYDIVLTLLVGGNVADLPLVVVPPLDAAILKATGNLSESGVNTLLKQTGDKAGRPPYDLNGDGRRDYVDDYILMGHYLLNRAGKAPQGEK